jgi:hypothetical protein
MTVEKAKTFLEQWVLMHVHSTVPIEHELEATRLALKCLQDANEQGIKRADLETAAGQDIVRSLLDAQKASADARIGVILEKAV